MKTENKEFTKIEVRSNKRVKKKKKKKKRKKSERKGLTIIPKDQMIKFIFFLK